MVLPFVLMPGNAEGARPNIIFLLTDDQRDNSIGAMGHPFVKTPHLDSLMNESVRFTNAYTATPVCAPSRISILTGLPERIHGVGFSSSYKLTEQQWDRTYPALLHEAGYHTGFVGKFGGEYGMGGKELLYDLTAKVPCFVYDPRLSAERRGLQLDQIVSTIDLTRTLLDYAGLDAPAEMEGQSLRPLVEGRNIPWREEMFLESHFSLRDNPFQEGVRTERWKYIRLYKGKERFLEGDLDFTGRSPALEMLFDLVADPSERDNLVSDPKHSEILAQLRARTAAESTAINQRRAAYMETIHVESRFPQ